MTSDLISKVYDLRLPHQGLVFHSDCGFQYTSKRSGKLLKDCGIRASLCDVGDCWVSAVVERVFGSLQGD